jgi:hypothetical protein
VLFSLGEWRRFNNTSLLYNPHDGNDSYPSDSSDRSKMVFPLIIENYPGY